MIKFVIALMVLFNVAWPVCTKISIPTDYSVVAGGSRAGLKANFDEIQTKVNPCMDSVDEVRARFTGYTGSFGVYSLENLLLRLDTDASASAKLVVQNSNGDSLFRVSEDSSARAFGAFRVGGAVTFSNYTSGQVPYFGTAGLVTGGTGLTYNGSAFSVTGTGAISSNATVGGTLGVTGASTLTGAVTVQAGGTALSISSSQAGTALQSLIANTSNTASSDARQLITVAGGSAGNPHIGLVVTGLTEWGVGIDNADGDALKIGQSTDLSVNNRLKITTGGAVTIPGTLGVTGVTTATGGLTLGASFVDKTTSLTSNTTLTSAHSTIFASASGGSFTLTLPAAAGNTGLTYTIYKTDVSAAATGGGNTVTIDGNASETIGGDLTQVLASNTGNGTLRIISNGTSWNILTLTDEGSFVLTLTGCTTSPTGTVFYFRDNSSVTLTIPGITATSNTTSASLTGIPASLQSTSLFIYGLGVMDNALLYHGGILITGSSVDLFFQNTISSTTLGFTNSGTKGVYYAISISYKKN